MVMNIMGYDSLNNFHQTDFRIQDSDKDGATDWYKDLEMKQKLVMIQ